MKDDPVWMCWFVIICGVGCLLGELFIWRQGLRVRKRFSNETGSETGSINLDKLAQEVIKETEAAMANENKYEIETEKSKGYRKTGLDDDGISVNPYNDVYQEL